MLAISLVSPMPVLTDGRAPKITSKYKAENPDRPTHNGVDLLYPRKDEPLSLPWTAPSGKWAVRDGIPAMAAASGVVTKAGTLPKGERVRINHGNGIETAYYHMRKIRVREGDRVKAGQPIGVVSYDPSSGLGLNHLHFEMFHNGRSINPRPYIESAALLPLPDRYLWLIGGVVAVGAGLYASKFIR